jgi:osmotically-inducible protein OsmY
MMNKTILISEMLQFHFGSKIFCSDGEGGVLLEVIFNPATSSMTHIAVKQGRLFGKSGYLPFTNVLSASEEGITLSVKRSDVAAANSQEPEGASLSSKSIVENKLSTAKGSLRLVAVHPEHGALAYVVARELRPGHATLLQEEYISALMKDRVTVSISDERLHSLPLYRPDSVLQQEVESVLFDFTPLHIDLKTINIRVRDSILYLDGNVSSTLRSDIVQDRVTGVEGLTEIKNRLIADDTLAADLARVLGQDERTRDLPIGVYPRMGTVRLSGAVHNSQQNAAAEELAKSFPGVRSVENNLNVDPNASMLDVMSAPEGGETKDIIPGKYVRHTQ